MSKFSIASVFAAKLVINEKHEPLKAWEAAMKKHLSHSPSMQIESCPKGAFLGLCSNGYIKGVPKGNYSDSKNGTYACEAVEAIRKNRNLLIGTHTAIWKMTSGAKKRQNSQIAIVLALIDAKLIDID